MRADFQQKNAGSTSHYVDQISVRLQHEMFVQDAMRALLQEANISNNIYIEQVTHTMCINKYKWINNK